MKTYQVEIPKEYIRNKEKTVVIKTDDGLLEKNKILLYVKENISTVRFSLDDKFEFSEQLLPTPTFFVEGYFSKSILDRSELIKINLKPTEVNNEN